MTRLRVLVVDDSSLAREILRGILERDGDIVVVGEAADGGQAVSLVDALRPDLVTMDIHMPGVDGWEAVERIMALRPTPILVVTANTVDDALAGQALRRGALDLVWKPTLGDEEEGRALREHVRLLARTPVVKHVRALTADGRGGVPPANPRRAPRVVGIAGSAGGPRAIATILAALPRDFPAPIGVVQHLPPGFAAPFAKFLSSITRLEVVMVERPTVMRPGVVYLSRDDRHLLASRAGFTADGSPPERGFRPSASLLFHSLAHGFGAAAIGVILSGIGSDGVSGLEAIVAQGGLTIAQNGESSIVYGMPKAAVNAGAAKLVLDVRAIAPALIERVRA